MPTFAYKARNKQGERVEGKHEASDKRTALLALRESELFVTQLDHLGAAKPKKSVAQSAPEPNGKWWWRTNAKNMSLYYRQLQAMLKAGVSLAQALTTAGESAPSKPLRDASLEMARRIAKGDLWSVQMREYPGLFSPLALAMIRSGEAGGFLDVACGKLSDYAEKDHRIKLMITRETWYPKMVFFSSIFTLNAPSLVVALFKHQNVRQAEIGYLVGVGIPLSIIFALWLLTSGQKFIMPLARHLKPLTRIIDQLKLMTPVAGKTVRSLAVAKFCRAFSSLNAAGLGVATSFELAGDACGNMAIASRIREIIPQVEQGKGITDSLAATRQFPNVVLQMMRTSEASGNFGEQIDSVADFMEDEGEASIHKSVVVMGLLLYLAVAGMVGYYVISFYVGYANNMMNMMQ